MKKTLIGLFAVATLLAQSAFAGCPLQRNSCEDVNPCEKASPCAKANPCDENRLTGCQDWLTQENLENYYAKMNLDDTQRCEAMSAVERFRAKTQNITGGECESKCDCRAYRHALKELDCDMKNILTSCQMSGYRSVRRDVKNQVKCCHKCLINPFTRCASCNNPCD